MSAGDGFPDDPKIEGAALPWDLFVGGLKEFCHAHMRPVPPQNTTLVYYERLCHLTTKRWAVTVERVVDTVKLYRDDKFVSLPDILDRVPRAAGKWREPRAPHAASVSPEEHQRNLSHIKRFIDGVSKAATPSEPKGKSRTKHLADAASLKQQGGIGSDSS
jgi:hypothetical protein